MKVTVRGVVFVVLLLIPTLLNVCFVRIWMLPVYLASRRWLSSQSQLRVQRVLDRVSDWAQCVWFGYASLLLQWVHATSFSFSAIVPPSASTAPPKPHELLRSVLSPPSRPGRSKIVMVNHHCRVDWLYLFIFFAAGSLGGHIRFVLKDDLRRIPVLGWEMQQFRYLFLSRRWSSDEAYIAHMTRYFKSQSESPCVVIFPEGTDLSPSNLAKSQTYARNNGLHEFRHVLTPRTTGLIAIHELLGDVDEIVDLTMAYEYAEGGLRPSELSLVNGTQPRKVHVLAQVFRAQSLSQPTTGAPLVPYFPSESSALASWIHERFAEKETILSRFFGAAPFAFDTRDVSEVFKVPAGWIHNYSSDAGVYYRTPSEWPRLAYFYAVQLCFWFVLPITVIRWLGWWSLIQIVVALLSMHFFEKYHGTYAEWLYHLPNNRKVE